MIQKTRQKILQYLKEHGEATVEELGAALNDLTPVTVRHHLDVLRSQGLVDAPIVLHRNSPGRPKFVYRLSARADQMFPKNVGTLAAHMIAELRDTLDERQINVIFEGVAERMAAEIESGLPDESFEARLERVIDHLSDHGYEAHWEDHPEGVVLHTVNCPYSMVAEEHHDYLCILDIRYISHLLGVVPRRLEFRPDGGHHCSYLVPRPVAERAAIK